MIKKVLIMITAAVLSIFMFAACTQVSGDSYGNSSASGSSAQAQAALDASTDTSLDFIKLDFLSADEDSLYNENTATKIELSDGSTLIDGSGVQEKGDVITISDEGEYIISGTLSDGQIVVDASDSDIVQIILSGASITNKSGSAIVVNKAEKLVLTLAKGTQNTVEDGSKYDDTSGGAPDAAIYAEEDLTINGSGSLGVTGSYMSGIKSVSDLIIMSGKISVTAETDGIRGKDSLTVNEADITVNAGADGMKSNNSKDEESGYIIIEGGNISITAGDAGIQAETGIIIDGGVFSIEAQQDTLNCNGSIRIAGGDITLSSGDDGIHANDSLDILGGNITVLQSFEGLEGTNVSIFGGNITITASDDGINAAGGSDEDSNPGDNFSSDSSCYISISGGQVHIIAGDYGMDGDGIDSNGDLFISGGVVIVEGPEDFRNTALDTNDNGSFEVTGGTIFAIGSSDMLVVPTIATQPVLTVVFDDAQPPGEIISVSDSSGQTIISSSSGKSFESVIVTAPDFKLRESYTVLLDNQEIFNFSFSDYVTTLDQSGNETQIEHFTGGPGGGMPGGDRPGPK